MRTLKIGIAGCDPMKARTLAIARGEHTPTQNEPKVWCSSPRSTASRNCCRNIAGVSWR